MENNKLLVHTMERKSAGYATTSITVPAIAYYSGNRIWYAITVPFGVLKSGLIRTSSVKKKGQEIIKSQIKNRFLDNKHKNDIKDYMQVEKKFTIPPVTLVCTEKLSFEPIFFGDISEAPKTQEELYKVLKAMGSLGGIIQIPLDYQFECLDGNHRTVAIRELAEEVPEITNGSNLLLNIVCESDLMKIRQDFVDVNKNAVQTSPSINTLFNTRDPLPNLVSRIISNSSYLEDITNVLATSVSKNSSDIYTLNNIKNAVIELSGVDSQGAKTAENKANKLLSDKDFNEEVSYRVEKFFEMLKDNYYLRECLNNKSNTSNIRNQSILTLGVGVAIAAYAANYIFENVSKDKQYDELRKLVNFDWSRKNPLFKHSGLISTGNQEKVVTSRASITDTKKYIIKALGYNVTL